MKPNTQTGIIIVASGIIALTILIIQGNTSKHVEPIIPQNDLYCGTVWEVRLNAPIDRASLETILRNEIAKLGSVYDIPEREIMIESLGNNLVKITIGGLWQHEAGTPDLGFTMENIEVISDVENYPGGPVQAWCQ